VVDVLRQLSNFSAISWREQVNFQWSTALEVNTLTITPPIWFTKMSNMFLWEKYSL